MGRDVPGAEAQPSVRLRGQALLALCGVVAPILFMSTVLILGFIRPGFNALTQFMSALGETGAPNAIVQDANFVVFGLLLVAFAYGLHEGINSGKGSKVGPILLVVNAAFGGAQGIFPADPVGAARTFSGNMHMLVGLIGIVALTPAPLVFSRRLTKDARWKGYVTYSTVTGIAMIVLFFASFLLIGISWKGLFQRFSFLIPAQWMEVMALRLLRLSTHGGPVPAA